MKILSADSIHSTLDWDGVLEALHAAHLENRPNGDSFFLGDQAFGLLCRGVILPGFGAGMKLAAICPANNKIDPRRSVEDAAFIVVDEDTKHISTILDGPAITLWKTAADSGVAARKLSREDSEVLLVLGAGPIARGVLDVYLHIRPSINSVLLWNRSPEKLDSIYNELNRRGVSVSVIDDLDLAVTKADIIVSATSTTTPLIRGENIRRGAHIDLVGGFRPDMQEAESCVLEQARIFVDDRATAAVSGDIAIPLRDGRISEDKIEADLYELCQDSSFIRSDNDITVYKNAGGAHLDLIISQYVIKRLSTD